MAATRVLTREKIFEIARSLPPAPKVLAGLGTLLQDVNVDLEQVTGLIKRDAILAAQIIRISNSVVYHGSGEVRVGEIGEAITRVGFHEVYRLMGLAMAGQLAERPLLHYGVKAELLREHMQYTALLCEALADASALDARQAYTAGLMRPLGILVLDRVAELLAPIEPYHHESCGSYAAWEGRVFSLSNCEVAALILSEWCFPNEIVDAVRDHYLLRDADYENRLACLLNLAGGIAAVGGYALAGEYRHWESTSRKLAAAGLTLKQINQASDRARDAFEALRKNFSPGQPSTSIPFVRNKSPVPASSAGPRPAAGREDDAPGNEPARARAAMDESVVPGVANSFSGFMRSHQDMVYSTAVRLVGNEAQAEDIAQEVFLRAHEHWGDLKAAATAAGWLRTVATNLSLNYLQRYRKRWSFFSELARDDESPEAIDELPLELMAPEHFFAAIDRADRHVWIEQALAQLPARQRVPLLLYHFDELPYEEIAAKLGVSLAKVKTDILRARAALARVLVRGAGREQLSR